MVTMKDIDRERGRANQFLEALRHPFEPGLGSDCNKYDYSQSYFCGVSKEGHTDRRAYEKQLARVDKLLKQWWAQHPCGREFCPCGTWTKIEETEE